MVRLLRCLRKWFSSMTLMARRWATLLDSVRLKARRRRPLSPLLVRTTVLVAPVL